MPARLRFLLFFLAIVSILRAQIATTSIVGRIVDPSNSPVAGASVKATRTETMQAFHCASDETGNFSLLQLPFGSYDLEFARQVSRSRPAAHTASISASK